jgi:hypothetical protein
MWLTKPFLDNMLPSLLALDLVDLMFVVTAVMFNLLIIGVYIAQKHERHRLVRLFGSIVICLAIPLAVVFISYLISGRALWIMIYLGFILLYIFVELLLDFILKIEFREKLILHIPYIILFYVASFGFIGISFSIDRTWGYIVSITFWAVLGSLIYLYWGRKKK